MLNGMNILVAEDDKLNQRIMNIILQKKGATVKVVLNGNEAIDCLSKDHFDVIIMDIQMPGMGGYATARYIRNNLKINIPIIALTADSSAGQTNEYIDAGMNTCICKPVDPASLCDLIISLVKESSNLILY